MENEKKKKKYIYIYIYKICKHVFFINFPVAGNKWNWKMKKNEYMYFFFGYFQWLEQIINNNEKKNI